MMENVAINPKDKATRSAKLTSITIKNHHNENFHITIYIKVCKKMNKIKLLKDIE